MKNSHVSIIEERQFITKEFADTLADKLPAPYLRLHDPVQRGLVDLAATLQGRSLGETAYLDRMIHFWREVSLAGLPRAGTSQDECHALLFESAFDLAEAEPEWALECLAEKSTPTSSVTAGELAHQIAGLEIEHSSIVAALTRLHAPMRESDPQKWSDELNIAFVGDVLFWNAMLCAVGIDEHHWLWPFRCALAQSSHSGWGDRHRLHARLIRESPQCASKSPRAQLMAHPILRLARLKYREGSVEQKQVLRFLNAQCIRQGFESEEDSFDSDLTLAQWVRDARQWATNVQEAEPQVCEELFDEADEKALDRTLTFYHQHLGPNPAVVDSLDATAALMRWANQRRGFKFSRYRAQRWEFVVEIANAALWLGWLCSSRRTNNPIQVSKEDPYLHDRLLDWPIIGASHMAEGVTDFSAWSKAMLARAWPQPLPEEGSLRPFLWMIYINAKRLFERAQKVLPQSHQSGRLRVLAKYQSLWASGHVIKCAERHQDKSSGDVIAWRFDESLTVKWRYEPSIRMARLLGMVGGPGNYASLAKVLRDTNRPCDLRIECFKSLVALRAPGYSRDGFSRVS